MPFWFQAGFKRHSPHIVFVHPPNVVYLLHVFPNPYLGSGGMPNPAVITTGSRYVSPKKKGEERFPVLWVHSFFVSCVFSVCRIYTYIYISVYICGYVYMYVFVSVWISITRLWFADIRRSVLHLYNSRNGLFVFGYPVLKTLGNKSLLLLEVNPSKTQ